MRTTTAIRMVFLIAVLVAASANGAPVLAQPGSTGGTVGKADKSLSGGEDAAPPAQRSTDKSHADRHETKGNSQRKRITTNSEAVRPTHRPAGAQASPSAGGHDGGGSNSGCPVASPDARFAGSPC